MKFAPSLWINTAWQNVDQLAQEKWLYKTRYIHLHAKEVYGEWLYGFLLIV